MTTKMSRMTRRYVSILALLLIGGLQSHAGDQAYGPIRTPMVPGVRALANAVRASLIRPYLADAQGDWLFASDLGSESVSGASNYATCIGNGSLSACISPWGELTALRWPHVTHSDQLRYYTYQNPIVTLRARPVRMKDPKDPDWKRYGRPIEPEPGLASEGCINATCAGSPGWKSARTFDPEDSGILVTRLVRPGMAMEVTDWIDPDAALMVRRHRVSGGGRFSYHANLAPWLASPGERDQSNPKTAGGPALWLPAEGIHLLFQLRNRDPELLRQTLAALPTETPEKLAALDRAFPDGGVFLAVGLDRPAAATSEMTLSTQLDPGEQKIAVFIAAAESATGAVELVMKARIEGAEALRRKAVARGQQVSAQVRMPAGLEAPEARVSRRSVLNLLMAQDRDTGAIVASLARQPQYHFDWPRDGAFFDLTLDLAGFPERVGRHHEFYRRTQMKAERARTFGRLANFNSPYYSPAGHWMSNMAADGTRGSVPAALPFEIDETALLVWDFWRHEAALPEAERPAYRAAMKETLALAADALLDYVDLKQGWTKPAIEDDNFPPDATLHGAASVLTGLAGACDAGPRFGMVPELTARWCEAARVLRAGIRGRVESPKILEAAGWRGVAWTLWPAPVFETYDEPGARLLKEKLAANIRSKMDKSRAGFAYLGEDVFILALADPQGEYRELCASALRLLCREAAYPGADAFGEVTVWGDFAGTGERVAQQRTSIPHLWNGVTVYLSALALYDREAFAGARPPVK